MFSARKQKGAAVLIMTVALLLVATIIALFSASVITTDNKIFNNSKANFDAHNAARAGFDYALGYMNAYPFVIMKRLAYCVSASTTYALPQQTLGNGSTYTATYSCKVANSYLNIGLSVQGANADGSATRTISATMKQYCGTMQYPVLSVWGVRLFPGTTISNTMPNADRSIASGGTGSGVIIDAGAAVTTTTGGLYSCTGARSFTNASLPTTDCFNVLMYPYDVNFIDPIYSLTFTTNPTASFRLDRLYLGVAAQGTLHTLAYAPVYNVNCPTNSVVHATSTFAALDNGSGGTTTCTKLSGSTGNLATQFNGITGNIVAMGTGPRLISLSNNTTFTMGSSAAPVILSFSVSTSTVTFTPGASNSSITINGNIYSTGPLVLNANTIVNGLIVTTGLNSGVTLNGNATVNGAIIARGQVTLNGTSSVNYTPAADAIIKNTFNRYCGGSYAVVPGTLKDF
ncbi:MAG TPA: polymer-forming cytoskeletal protein [Coxiellaceae bacterium]|nr:MAG: hypothetical protein A3E81_07365 [Gammaproteobacteria bacterium RIFCSPHIGHO2_12_FULL_36_30]HLB57156.1 polymer-forming cytoskeletal protein [Coxiellaceae bacterium]